MAETVHLYLKANGTDIKGESTQTSLGRQNSIECLYFEHAVQTAREAGSGVATGKRQYAPLVIRKRIDKSSPLLFKALTQNQVMEGTFKFFRPNPTGDGTTEQYYTIVFKQGRVASFKQFSSSGDCNGENINCPDIEEVSFVFHSISLTHVAGGITHEDSWNQQR